MTGLLPTGVGVDVPDSRGRTGLDAAGRELDRNPDVIVRDVEVTSDGWHVLRRTTLDVRRRDGRWDRQQRETYDRGDGATILPFDPTRNTVLLARQFRYPAYVNGHEDGMLVEAAAGLLDLDDPETAIRREAAEELGVRLGPIRNVMNVFMSPGSVTERVHCFIADYAAADRVDRGGGLEGEGEDIEVLEVPFHEAMAMTEDGRIVDGKTILLLQFILASRLLGERLRAATIVSGAVGVTGVALIVLRPSAALDPVGVVAALLGAFSMTIGVVLSKRWAGKVSPLASTAWQLVSGGLILSVLTVVVEPLPDVGFEAGTVLGFAYLTLVGTAFAYLVWFRGVAVLPARTPSFLGLLSPVVAVAIGVSIAGEHLAAAQGAGVAMVIGAIGFTVSGAKDTQPSGRTPA